MQILSAQQTATAMVFAYPFTPKLELMLEELAANQGEPAIETLHEDTSVDDFQHAAHWEAIKRYLTLINTENVFEYVPLVSR